MTSKKTDLRQLTSEQLTAFREQAIKQIQSGVSVEKVMEGMGVSRSAIFNWLSLYRSGGWGALKSNKRGGRPKKINGEVMSWIYMVVTNKQPDQMSFPFALWTAKLVGKALEQHWGIKLSRWSVSRVMHQLGLSPQKPLRRAYQQKPELVEEWKINYLPELKEKIKNEGGELWYQDESSVKSNHHSGRTWGKVGETPNIPSTGARFSLNMIGAISTKGVFRFQTFKGTMDADRYILFLKRLMKDSQTTTIHLVVDGHPVHKSKKVKNYVESLNGNLVLHVLPPYSPELNPIELVWNHVKTHQIGKKTITGPDQMKSLILGALRHIQKLPELVKKFFKHPECGLI